jgi:CRISPR/Cas system-associated exonuclease Cas4 (RecB family)
VGHGISQTALGVYRSCPFAYKCYREKKAPLMFNQEILDSGGLVHDALDSYYKSHYLTEATPDDILYETYNILKIKWDTSLQPTELHKAYTCLRNHSIWEAQNLVNGIIVAPDTEVALSNQFFYGIVDYIDSPHDFIMDWKTGKAGYLTQENKIQAYVYRQLYQDHYKRQLKKFSFYYLYSNDIKTIDYDAYYMKDVATDVEQLKQSMMNDIANGTYQKQPRTDNTCKYCTYRVYCRF